MNYLENQIKKGTMYTIRLYLFLIIISLLIAFVGPLKGNIQNLFKPYTRIRQISQLENGMYSKFLNTTVYNLYYDYTLDGKKAGSYGMINTSDGYLVVLFKGDDQKLIGKEKINLVGTISPLESYEKNMIDDVLEQEKEDDETFDVKTIRSEFSIYKLTYGNEYIGNRIFAFILIGIAGLFIVLIIFKFRIYNNYKLSKLYKKLGINADTIESKINREIESGKFIELDKKSKLTDSSILIIKGGSISLYNIDDLLWIYKNITKHYTNGIPTGKTYSLKFIFKDKKMKDIPVIKEKKCDELIEKIMEKHPSIIYGYSDELAIMFNKKIDEFIKMREEKGKSIS